MFFWYLPGCSHARRNRSREKTTDRSKAVRCLSPLNSTRMNKVNDSADINQACTAAIREELPAPIGRLLGLTLIREGVGRTTIEFQATGRYANPMGTLHGGVLCDIADAAMGMAYRSTLADGETFTTIELKINFLRPVWAGRLRAQGRVVRAGSTVGLVECSIFDDRKRLVARASSTCMTLRGRLAEGRGLPTEINAINQSDVSTLEERHKKEFIHAEQI
jgi:uncharacterized protein (TIGR00369 family)